MKRAVVILALLLVQACASGPRIETNYSAASKVALVNGVGPKATYTYIGLLSRAEESFEVDWGIPELAEDLFRKASNIEFVGGTRPAALADVDLDELATTLEKQPGSDEASAMRQLCQEADADAVVVLGTKYRVWTIGGLTYFAGGYGGFRGSTGKTGKAYALVAAGVVDCQYLRLVSSAWFQRELVTFNTEVLPKEPADLTPEALASMKPYVIEALTTGADDRQGPPLVQVAGIIDGVFGRAEDVND